MGVCERLPSITSPVTEAVVPGQSYFDNLELGSQAALDVIEAERLFQ